MKIRTLLVTAALSASTLLAQPGPGRGPRGEANLDSLKQVLELTDQQVTDLKAARQTFFENELRPIMEQVREKRQALREEIRQDSPNASIVGQLQVEIAELGNQAKAKRAEHAEQLRATLTDAQRVKLDELQAAANLLPAIQQARGLSLLDSPERGFGMGGPMGGPRAFRGRRGMMR
jgi:Spy/CpxP family protein refolding chaperone